MGFLEQALAYAVYKYGVWMHYPNPTFCN